MKSAFGRFVAAAQAFALTGVLSACMLTGGDTLVVPGGAEDFPNTMTPLGRVAVSDFTSVGNWEQIPVVTPPMPELPSLDSLQIAPPTGKLAAFGKRSSTSKVWNGLDTLNMDLWVVDTTKVLEAYLLGRIYAYAADSSSTHIQRDTVVALYLGDRSQSSSLSAARDSIESNPGKFLMPLEFRGTARRGAAGDRNLWLTQSYRLRNVNNTGTIDQAEYQTTTFLPDGGTQRKWVKIYGAEGTYADAQAVPEEYELLHRGPAGDTVSWTSVKDADWDRKLWTSEARGVVDLYFRVRNPAAHPSIARMHSYLRAEYRLVPGGGDSLGQLNYQEQRWLRNGRNVTFTFQGLGTADDLLVGSDTARMTVDTVFALRDSMIKYSATYKMLLGPVPDLLQDHKLVSYSVQKYWRMGGLYSNVSHFFPETPVLVGQSGFAGRMSTTSAYRNGDTTTTEGSIDSAGFNLVVKNVKNNVVTTYDVVLDIAGEVISYAPASPDATAATRAASPVNRR